MNTKALLALTLAAVAMAACAPRYYDGHRGYGYDRVGHHDRYDRDRYDRNYDRHDRDDRGRDGYWR